METSFCTYKTFGPWRDVPMTCYGNWHKPLKMGSQTTEQCSSPLNDQPLRAC